VGFSFSRSATATANSIACQRSESAQLEVQNFQALGYQLFAWIQADVLKLAVFLLDTRLIMWFASACFIRIKLLCCGFHG